MMLIPNPGTKEAQDMGCICPVIDNHYGKGVPLDGKRQFWMIEGCPLHDINKWSKNVYRQRISTKRSKNR